MHLFRRVVRQHLDLRFRRICTQAFTDRTNKAVTDFLEYRDEETQFRVLTKSGKIKLISPYEVNNITQSVAFMMRNIILKSSEKDRLFSVKYLQLIGSMHEGTKIVAQNEFDFFAVFDYDLIGDKNMRLEPGCRPGFTKIRVNGDSQQWSDCCQELYLSPHLCMSRFESLLPSQLGDVEPVKTTSGSLYGWMRKKRTFVLMWENNDYSMQITVDVMPAFGVFYKDLPKALREDCTDSRMEQLGADHSSFLIPRSCEHHNEGKCWHNSFAHAESELIRNMDPDRKRCHRVLKLIFTGEKLDRPSFLSSYALKSAVMYKHKKTFENDLEFLVAIFVHFAKCFDQTCMPTYFLTKTNVWKNILEHRTHNIWGSSFLYDYRLNRQIIKHVGEDDLTGRFPAWNVAVVLEFWRRMMILMIVLFSSSESSMNISFFINVIHGIQSKSNTFYLEYLRNRKACSLLAAPQYDVLNIRRKHRKVIRVLDIPVFTELTKELSKYGILDATALNRLIIENRHQFQSGNGQFINLDVRRYENVYVPYRSSCRTEATYRHLNDKR